MRDKIANLDFRIKLLTALGALSLLCACAGEEIRQNQESNEATVTELSGPEVVAEKPKINHSLSWPLLPLNELPETPKPETKPAIAETTPEKKTEPIISKTLPQKITQKMVEEAQAEKEKKVMPPPPPISEAKLEKLSLGPQSSTNPRKVMATLKPSPIVIPTAKTAEGLEQTPLLFDIPVAYNSRVKYWIEYFQTSGRPWFTKWLERSSRYLPVLQQTLKKNDLPQDLAYIAMIESGFSSQASSTAQAVGPWQFIRETGKRYGLQVTWWLDERRDFQKSTDAAAKYLKKMYSMFHNWYLVAAGYNTGENRIKRIIQKHGTTNFWKIAQERDLEDETKDYVPKLIAALLIAKAPKMYGFKNVNYAQPLSFEFFHVPGGTHLDDVADAIGVTSKYLLDLNPELIHGIIPSYVEGHTIRIPKGASQLVGHFIRQSLVGSR